MGRQKKNTFMFIIMAFVLTLLCFAPLIKPTPVSAESNTESLSFDETNIITDLESAGFNFHLYPYNKLGKTQIFNFIEYGFTHDKNSKYYGLYIYIYNPTSLIFDTNSQNNKIQIATQYDEEGKPISYEKFNLVFLNKAEDAEYKNLYLKFKIQDNENKIFNRLKIETRRYDVSGFELLEKNKQNAVEYSLGGTYTFTGFAKGCGSDTSAESTLACQVNELETISFNVNSTYYRPEVVSGLGEGHQNNLSSVYFSVDNTILEKYGSVQKIKAEWYEYKTQPIFVTNNLDVFNGIDKFIGQDISNNSNALYGIGMEYADSTDGNGEYEIINYYRAYNIKNNSTVDNFFLPKILYVDTPVNTLYYQFYDKDLNGVSANSLKEYIYSYDKSATNGYLNLKQNDISADLFTSTVDEGRSRGYNLKEFDANEEFNMLSYNTENGAWKNFWNYFLSGKNTIQDFTNISPIHQVKAEDMSKGDDYIIDSLYINDKDVEAFKSYYQTETAKGKTVILFRYAVTDYYSSSCKAYKKTENSNIVSSLGNVGFIAEETVFLDFDIIQLTFNKEGNYTAIPVVASPIDIIADITPPIKGEGGDWWAWLKNLLIKIGYCLLIVLACVLVIAFLPQILTIIVKLIIWIVKLPFVIYKKIKGGGKRK